MGGLELVIVIGAVWVVAAVLAVAFVSGASRAFRGDGPQNRPRELYGPNSGGSGADRGINARVLTPDELARVRRYWPRAPFVP